MDPHELVQEPTKRMMRIKILLELFEAEQRRLSENVSQLIRKHEQITHTMVDGFLYRGNWVKKPGLTLNTKSHKPMMDPSLNDAMAKHINDAAIVERDRSLIDQVIHKALTHCMTFQDVRDALPELVVEFVEGVRDISRIRQPLFFQNNLRDIRDWERVMPKIEMYYAGRLLY